MTMQTYRLDRYRMNVGGFDLARGVGASGFADDGAVLSIEPDGPIVDKKRGQDGTWVLYNTYNQGAKITFRAMSTNSPTNGFLSGLVAADVGGTPTIVSWNVEDLSGTSVFVAPTCRLVTMPKWEIQVAPTVVEWEFFGIWSVWVVGGN